MEPCNKATPRAPPVVAPPQHITSEVVDGVVDLSQLQFWRGRIAPIRRWMQLEAGGRSSCQCLRAPRPRLEGCRTLCLFPECGYALCKQYKQPHIPREEHHGGIGDFTPGLNRQEWAAPWRHLHASCPIRSAARKIGLCARR